MFSPRSCSVGESSLFFHWNFLFYKLTLCFKVKGSVHLCFNQLRMKHLVFLLSRTWYHMELSDLLRSSSDSKPSILQTHLHQSGPRRLILSWLFPIQAAPRFTVYVPNISRKCQKKPPADVWPVM
ncbi:hypothetical protein CHARACLAT_015103 [Characodon lateralis]|uniref:Uncharacterized protein n=1 Tax=Characodon lateralis TaxID=208331 RepID=A0ABU7E9T6_9TELE|nr:hypothetical protein [Characodon lateralis]